MISAKSAPYTGVYASDATKHPAKGPTVEAIKRALARLDYMAWKGTAFTQLWPAGGELDKSFRKWERDHELPGNGVYGEQEWKYLRGCKIPSGPKKGQHALDRYACDLIRADWAEQNVPDELDFRKALTNYCLTAEVHEPAWHYVQYRPVDVSQAPNASYIRADCSSFVIMSWWWSAQAAGMNQVPDPSKMGWSGYGNTELHLNDHPRVTEPFKVGDLAHYNGHVTVCRRPGTATSAVFTSHGQEAGPIPTQIYYRSDFLYVVRPPLK